MPPIFQAGLDQTGAASSSVEGGIDHAGTRRRKRLGRSSVDLAARPAGLGFALDAHGRFGR